MLCKGTKENPKAEGVEIMEINLDLVRRAKNRDTEAFALIYKKIWKNLYRFALYTLGNPQDAEDAVSESVMAAYEQIHKLRKEDSFKPWIFQILANRCKRKKKEYVDKCVPLEDDYFEPRPELEAIYDVHKAMNSLKKEERMVIALTVFGGYNSREVAKILKMNANTVRTRKSQGFAKLKTLLK